MCLIFQMETCAQNVNILWAMRRARTLHPEGQHTTFNNDFVTDIFQTTFSATDHKKSVPPFPKPDRHTLTQTHLFNDPPGERCKAPPERSRRVQERVACPRAGTRRGCHQRYRHVKQDNCHRRGGSDGAHTPSERSPPRFSTPAGARGGVAAAISPGSLLRRHVLCPFLSCLQAVVGRYR